MAQRSFEGDRLQTDLEQQGYSLINHGIEADAIDELIAAYAQFTDNLPEPEPQTLARMILDPEDLDELDYSQDTQIEWHKYRTNHPQFAKPGGYTNRDIQVEVLQQAGRHILKNGTELTDDPKEFYHFHPNSLARINQQHKEFGWGPLPPEVTTLHMRFTGIHRLAQTAIRSTYALLEESHPELISKFLKPADLISSPLRLLFYHPRDDEVLAKGHYDKSCGTIQLAESHIGLRVSDPETGGMQMVRRPASQGAFFAGLNWSAMYPDSTIQPGWHDVIKVDELSEARQLHGRNCARWALIWFTDSTALEIPTKDKTHSEALMPLLPHQLEVLAQSTELQKVS